MSLTRIALSDERKADLLAALTALIYLPLLDRLYAAAEGTGARLNVAPIAVGARDIYAATDAIACSTSMKTFARNCL